MDRINGLNQLMRSLRQQFTDNVNRSDKGGRTQRIRDNSRSITRARKKPTIEQLENQVVERIKSLDRENGDFSRQAKQVFVELVIVWEFGDQIRNDLQFPEMTRAVMEMFESNTSIRGKLQSYIEKISDKTPSKR